MAVSRYVSEPFSVPVHEGERDFYRADLLFFGVDHSGPSFEARVFLNNPEADETTPREKEAGYAGSFFIFGHGGCFGELGHCDVPQGSRDPFDFRLPHPLTPVNMTVIVTEALKELRDASGGELTVTVVAVAPDWMRADENMLRFDRVALRTYD